MVAWRERFHAAFYTSVLMGAVLARAYNEPFFPNHITGRDTKSEQCRGKILDKLKVNGRNIEPGRGRPRLRLDTEEVEYLTRFPVYDLGGDLEAKRSVFEPFTRWLVETRLEELHLEPRQTRFVLNKAKLLSLTGRDGQGPEMTNWPGPETWGRKSSWSNYKAGEVLWVVMQTLHLFEFLCCAGFENEQHATGQGRHLDICNCPDRNYAPSKGPTANVVLFGVFRGEKVSTPKKSSLSKKGSLRASVLALPEELNFIDIPEVLEVLYLESSPNLTSSGPATPPPLQFYEFLLWDKFDMMFGLRVFGEHDGAFQDYFGFVSRATIFANGFEYEPARSWYDCTNGSEILATYDGSVIRYHAPGVVFDFPRRWERYTRPRAVYET